VDNTHYSLVIAAAQAAGPCPPGDEAGPGAARVQGLTVDLHLIAQAGPRAGHRAAGVSPDLHRVSLEEGRDRGVRAAGGPLPHACGLPSGPKSEAPIRTEQKDRRTAAGG